MSAKPQPLLKGIGHVITGVERVLCCYLAKQGMQNTPKVSTNMGLTYYTSTTTNNYHIVVCLEQMPKHVH
jgi:hypothetical protein